MINHPITKYALHLHNSFSPKLMLSALIRLVVGGHTLHTFVMPGSNTSAKSGKEMWSKNLATYTTWYF